MGEGIQIIGKGVRSERGTYRISGRTPQEKIQNRDKNYRITAYGAKSRTPMALSNYAFGLTQNVRKEKFPFLDNVGIADKTTAFKYVIASSMSKGANSVAKALNESKLGAKSWTVVDKNPIKLEYTDPNGNKHQMVNVMAYYNIFKQNPSLNLLLFTINCTIKMCFVRLKVYFISFIRFFKSIFGIKKRKSPLF